MVVTAMVIILFLSGKQLPDLVILLEQVYPLQLASPHT